MRQRGPTPLEWGLLVAGLLLTNHYAWVLDDAFVYFRYVDNWVLHGHGLVYNPGEYVEGFTSPLWTLLLAALRPTGIDYWLAVRLLGLGSYAAFWWMLVRLNRELSPRDGPVLDFPLVYLGLNYAVLSYFTSGTESPLVQLSALAYALVFVRPARRFLPHLLALTPLVRPELAVAFAIALLHRWRRTRRFPLGPALSGVVAVGGWQIFRVVYYADLLPNTFYLKDLADWGQGLRFLGNAVHPYGLVPVGLLCVLALVLGRRRGDDVALAPRALMWAVAALIALYFVRIGGAAQHYRYLAFSFCLAVAASAGLAERTLRALAPRLEARAVWLAGAAAAVFFAWLHPPQLLDHPIRANARQQAVDEIAEAAFHRSLFGYDPWSLAPLAPTRRIGPSFSEAELDSGVLVTGFCQAIYFLPEHRVIHKLGLTDAILARVDVPPDRPAHKRRLIPMAAELAQVQRAYPAGRGMYRRAVEDGGAASWIARNLDSIEAIERKIYNEHDPLENLALAVTFPPRIDP